MHQPLSVTVDSAKGIARMSGPLTLGNTYKVGWSGLTDEEAAATPQPQLVILGIPQLTDEWESGNPETRVAAMTDDEDVLALNTAELVDAFKAAPSSPMPPVPPRDPRRPARPMGVALHGTARPHGAIPLHFYVTAGGETLAQGDCTLLWAPFEFDGTGTPVVLQGPKGDKGEQGPKGDRGEAGRDAVIATSAGCVTFQVCYDEDAVDGEGNSLYGHLLAYADNDYELYHGGDHSKPHFILGRGTGAGGNGYANGHLFYVYYPADPATATSAIDLGDVRGPQGPTDSGAVFAAALTAELEREPGEMTAWNLNTAIRLGNAINAALRAAAGQVTALLLAFLIPFLFCAGTADAQEASPRAARASARAAVVRALRANQQIHGQWTMFEQGGVILNTGVDGADGNLTRTEGATFSTNVPPCNYVDGQPQGHSLAFAAINNVAAAESANEYDPLAGAAKFTVCAWVRRTYRDGMGTAQRIVSDVDGRTAASGNNGFEFRFAGNDGRLYLRLNGKEITSGTAKVSPDDDVWHHVAVSYDSTRSGIGTSTASKNVHFYVDAVLKGAGSVALMGEVAANGVPLTLGNSSAGRELSGILNGELDNVFVIRDWSPAPPAQSGMTSTDIRALMSINDYDDEPEWDPEPDPPAPDHDYDIGVAETLGEMHPTNTLYTAEQVDALLAIVGANADWLEIVGNLASNALPSSWTDSAYLPGLDVGGSIQAGEFILDGESINEWSDINTWLEESFLPMWPGWYQLDDTKAHIESLLGIGIYRSFIPKPHGQKQLHIQAGELPLHLRSASEDGIKIVAQYRDETLDMDLPSTINLYGNVRVDGEFRAPGIVAQQGDGEGVVSIDGYGTEINLDEGFFTKDAGDWNFRLADGTFRFASSNRPAWNETGLATTNDLAPLAAATNALNERIDANADDIADLQFDIGNHTSATNNPHRVTAAQVGALSTNGGSVRGDIILGTNSTTPALVFQRMAPNDGNLDYRLRADGAGFFLGVRSSTGTWADHYRFLPGPAFAFGKNTSRAGYYAFAHGEDAAAPSIESFASGYHVTASGFAARATGGWSQALASYAEAGGYAAVASNEMSHVWNAGPNTNNTYGSHGGGTWNINPRGGLAGAYVGETNLADHIAAAVAPVERRVERLEYPDWCTLYWGTNVLYGNNLALPIPTNFPTSNLRIYIIDTYASAVDLVVQTNWAPQGDCMIEILATAASAQTNRDIRLKIGGTQIEKLTSQTTRRKWVLCFDSTLGYWHVRQETFGYYNYIYLPSGYQAWTFPSTAPKTVEEWLSMQSRQGASPLSPSLSPSAGHLEDLDSLDSLDELDEADEAEEEIEEEMR